MIRKLLGMVFPALKPSSSRRDELETLLADSSADRASFDAHEGTLLRNILGLRDLNCWSCWCWNRQTTPTASQFLPLGFSTALSTYQTPRRS